MYVYTHTYKYIPVCTIFSLKYIYFLTQTHTHTGANIVVVMYTEHYVHRLYAILGPPGFGFTRRHPYRTQVSYLEFFVALYPFLGKLGDNQYGCYGSKACHPAFLES